VTRAGRDRSGEDPLRRKHSRTPLEELQAAGVAYEFRDAGEVKQFLSRHPDALDTLLEAYSHLVKHFGQNAQFVLEVVRDPEADSPEGEEELFVLVRTRMAASEASERLHAFDA
jgi:hypothetical protein